MALKDSALEKWLYREHTRVKHKILKGYLGGWLAILGRWHKRVCYFDCFAGRGEWIGEQDGKLFPGSSVLAIETADRLTIQRRVGQFVCTNIEKDAENFENLKSVMSRYQNSDITIYNIEEKELEEAKNENKENNKDEIRKSEPRIVIYNIHGEFFTVISRILNLTGAGLAPSFFFIDPFGFKGVPFNIVKGILSVPKTEIFFTFMYRDINRFLGSANAEEVFNELFGTKEWQDLLKQCPTRREHALRELYIKQLQEKAGTRCVRAFRVYPDKRIQTLYYLVHATNHPKGACLMKEVMHRCGTPGLFAYLGPQDFAARYQLPLLPKVDDIEGLKKYLLEYFAGRTITFDQIREETWTTDFIEKEYRKALKELESRDKVSIERISSKKKGVKGNDLITFSSKNNKYSL